MSKVACCVWCKGQHINEHITYKINSPSTTLVRKNYIFFFNNTNQA